MDELISKRAVIEAIEKARANVGHNLERSIGKSIIEILDEVGRDVDRLPPALGTNLAEVGTDAISRQLAIDALCRVDEYNGRSIEAIRQLPSAQPYTINPDGRLWITVDDIDKVTAVVVDEHKSKFCKQFYEDYEDAHPEIIRCRECKFASGDSRICMKFGHSPIGELDFCAWAERREVTT